MSKDPGYSNSKADRQGSQLRDLERDIEAYKTELEICKTAHARKNNKILELQEENEDLKRQVSLLEDEIYEINVHGEW